MIEDIKSKLETEKDVLTDGEKANLAALIDIYETQRADKLADLVEQEAKAQEDAEKKKYDALIKATDGLIKKRETAVRLGEMRIAAEYDNDMVMAELENAENKKTQMRLEAEKKRMKALLALYEKDGHTLSEVELDTLRKSIEAVDKELEQNKKKRDLYDMLGFSLTDDQKGAIDEAVGYALDNLSSYIDAWVEAADKKRQIADGEVERAKSLVDTEIEARNKGYAANVAMAQKELDMAKVNQRKAIAEQQRAQRAQMALQTVSQASNLVTASSLIWSQLGFPWAIPAIAVMWGSFAAAKIKAMQVTKQGTDEEYGEGTVEMLEGGSHQSGNDIDLGRKKDGTRRRAEGGEFFAVINRRNSRRYRNVIPDVINSLNHGTFAEKYMRAYDGDASVNVLGTTPDLSALSNDVRQIREQGERRTYTDGAGNTIVEYKNLRQIIKN